MALEDKLAFLEADLEELSPVALWQLKWKITAEKRREAEASTKAQGSNKQPTAELDSSNFGT
jgi:hypothetical protein